MQDRSHKLVFLGLTALMGVAAFYGSEAGPTLLIGNDVQSQAVVAVFASRDERASLTDLSNAPFVAKLAPDGACTKAASDVSPPCLATSKISLSSP